MLQTLADGIKLFFKEQSIPDTADRPVFRLAPYLSILPAFLMFCVVPIGGTVSILGHHTYLQVADLPIGVLFILAMSGIGVYGVMLAGWSSGSKYPLLGSVRASAQLLSYEAAFGLAILGVLIQAGTLSTHDDRRRSRRGRTLGSFVTRLVLAAGARAVRASSSSRRPPRRTTRRSTSSRPSRSSSAASTPSTPGIRFAIFFLAEFMNVITMSAIAVTLFLGGPSGPSLGFLRARRRRSTSGSCRSSGSS